jgi:hypothetical protein
MARPAAVGTSANEMAPLRHTPLVEQNGVKRRLFGLLDDLRVTGAAYLRLPRKERRRRDLEQKRANGGQTLLPKNTADSQKVFPRWGRTNDLRVPLYPVWEVTARRNYHCASEKIAV